MENHNEENNIESSGNTEMQALSEAVKKIKNNIGQVLVGQEETVHWMLAGMFSDGHLLLEGVPGIAKTLVAKLLASSMDLEFRRIQFTPDLMPADVIGSNVFNTKIQDFEFRKGPVFGNIILIDEINRSPAKTQAALFEVMEENQISVDGNTHYVPHPFMVLATQNPVEQEGTYRLPEAQQDRFIMKLIMDYPSAQDELEILKRFYGQPQQELMKRIHPVLKASDIKSLKETIQKVHVSDALLKYIADVVVTTRSHRDLFLGASPRASLAIMKVSRAVAAMDGRDYVTPDDIRSITFPVLNHRLILSPESEMEGVEIQTVIEEILQQIEIPR